jgi:mannose-1-phosphate guanylyltransferase
LSLLRSAPRARFASPPTRRDSVVVFSGDVLTEIDLQAVIAHHRERKTSHDRADAGRESRPTVSSRVDDSNILRFLEARSAPDHDRLINAGIYILEAGSLTSSVGSAVVDRAELFPTMIERRGGLSRLSRYWIDIGTPEKAMQVHRDIMAHRYHAAPFASDRTGVRLAIGADRKGAIVEALFHRQTWWSSGARSDPTA